MTASTVKSVNITNISAPTRVALNSNVFSKNHVIDTIAAATTSLDDVGDVILFGPIPSNAVIHKIELQNDDLDSGGTSGAVNVGLYYAGNSLQQRLDGNVIGTVVDADCFASAITQLTGAIKVWTEITYESGVMTQADVQKEAWEMGGLSTDPGGHFCLGLTITTVMTTPVAGDISVRVSYSLPNA